MPELSRALKGRKGINQYIYSTAKGKRRSELPRQRATFSVLHKTKTAYAVKSREETITAWVILIWATLIFLCERWIEATTDAPMPNIKATPVLRRKRGAVILTAASASLPIPLPTKIPSVIINMAENTIPSTVGISNFRKSLGMFMVPKSMLSFIRFNVKNYSFYVNAKVRQR